MKFASILLLMFFLSLPVAGMVGPQYYNTRPKVEVSYCYCDRSYCHYCYPLYNSKPSSYYCYYCKDYGCSECDKAIAKLGLIALITTAAAYLINEVLKS